MKMKLLLAIAMLLPAGALRAADNPGALAIILDQQHTLQSDLDAGKTNGMTPRQLGVVRKAQKEVFALTDGKTSLDELSIDDKVRLENALERINAEVKGGRVAKDDQNVCWRERKSGSSMKVTRCGTQAERDQARQGAREWMDKPKICAPPGCGN